jgi:iron complex transport system permease protein
MSTPKKKAGTGTRPSAARTGTRSGGSRPGVPKAAKTAGKGVPAAGRGRSAVPTPRGSGLVVGTIPVGARIAGFLGLLAALLTFVRPAFSLVSAGGVGLGGAHNLWDFLVPLPLAAVVGTGGALVALGKLPRFGLAILLAAGGYAAGLALRLVPLFDTRNHSTSDLPIPEGVVRYVRYGVGAGLVLELVAVLVLVAAAILAALAWRRTVMDDAGSFDPLRPTFGTLGAVGAILGLVAVASPSASGTPAALSVPIQSLFDRIGLDQVGGWVQWVAFAVVATGAAISRPRLSVVGMFVGLAALSATAGLADLLLVIRSTALTIEPGPVLALVTAAWFTLLALGAWKLTRRPRADNAD